MAMLPGSSSGEDGGGGRGWTDTEGGNINADYTEGRPEDSGRWSVGGPGHPTFCLFKGVADGLAGGVMGSVFGFGSGLFKRQGVKVALREGASSAKTFALLSGVHSIVSCYLKRLRGKEDAWNAGLAGCATGLALSTPGTPVALAQSCLSFGAFSFVLEYMNQPRAAIAATSRGASTRLTFNTHVQFHLNLPVLPPFTLPPLSFSSLLPFHNQHGADSANPCSILYK